MDKTREKCPPMVAIRGNWYLWPVLPAACAAIGFRPWVYFAGNIRRHICGLVLGGILCYNHRELLRKG